MQLNGAHQTTVAATRIPLPDGTRTVLLQNLGATDVWLGSTAASATSVLGVRLAAAAVLQVDVALHDLYAASPLGLQVSPADLRWLARG